MRPVDAMTTIRAYSDTTDVQIPKQSAENRRGARADVGKDNVRKREHEFTFSSLIINQISKQDEKSTRIKA